MNSPDDPNPRPPNRPEPKPIALPQRVLDLLWRRMIEIYGASWIETMGEAARSHAGTAWARGLADLSAAKIGAGVDACRTSVDLRPPTLPEFRLRCHGVPPMGALLKYRAMPEDRVHGLGAEAAWARHVWSFLDHRALGRLRGPSAMKYFDRAYRLAVESYMAGLPLPPARSMSRETPGQIADREVAQRHMSEIAEALRLSPEEAEHFEKTAAEAERIRQEIRGTINSSTKPLEESR